MDKQFEQRREAEYMAFQEAKERETTTEDFSENEKEFIHDLIFGKESSKAEFESTTVDEEELNGIKTTEPMESVRIFNDEGKCLLNDENNKESAKLAIIALKDIGCDFSEALIPSLTAQELYEHILLVGKPKAEENLKDAEDKDVERDTESTLVTTQYIQDGERKIHAAGYEIKLIPESSSHTGFRLEVYTDFDKVQVYKEDLKPGVCKIPRTGENEIVVNLQQFNNEKVVVEFSQKNADLIKINKDS